MALTDARYSDQFCLFYNYIPPRAARVGPPEPEGETSVWRKKDEGAEPGQAESGGGSADQGELGRVFTELGPGEDHAWGDFEEPAIVPLTGFR